MFALAACTGPFFQPGTGSGETIPEGMGAARISLGGGEGRTILPDTVEYYFTLDFTALGKEDVRKTLEGNTSLTVALEPADWTVEVTGYADPARTVLMVRGSAGFTVNPGVETACTVPLARDFSAHGTGSLAYRIDLSQLPATIRGSFSLRILDNTPGTGKEIDLSPDTGGTAAGTLTDLFEGAYLAVVDLYDNAANTAAVWTGAVHIDNGSVTTLDRSFTAGDFVEADPQVITGANTLAAKLTAALGSSSGSYTISLDGTETDLAAFAPKTLSVTPGKNITITLRGNGHEVQLGLTKGNLFIVGPSSGSHLTLVLQDVTLRGRTNNTHSLVQVNERGTLEMKAGSRVTGNTHDSPYSYSYGGGVYVNTNGTFTMSGGEVSGNTAYTSHSPSQASATSYGGGVYVNSGTFTMSGGEVSGNTAYAYADSSYNPARASGGGVYVIGGTFTMSGGKVSGNTANSDVWTSSSSSSTSYGGGVYVGIGTFIMSGGEVSGNTADADDASGGGVYVDTNGTFTMSGGEVRDNILSGADTYGREVLIDGPFKISGDARPQRVFLYNNTRYITISGPLSGGVVPIDLGITAGAPLVSWSKKPVLALDSSYSGGDLADLKTYFTLGNYKETDSSATETAIPAEYTIGDDGSLPNIGISGISYSNIWTLEADGRRKSPAIDNTATTKERVSFTSTEADAVIVVQLEVSSQSGAYAFISELDNDSATYYTGYFAGSRIFGTASVTVSIPVPAVGSHFIDICYSKNVTETAGSDCAWFRVIE
jgi:hypothetical protein